MRSRRGGGGHADVLLEATTLWRTLSSNVTQVARVPGKNRSLAVEGSEEDEGVLGGDQSTAKERKRKRNDVFPDVLTFRRAIWIPRQPWI